MDPQRCICGDSPLVRRIMRARAFVFCGVATREDLAGHKERFCHLVKRLDAPQLVRLSACGRVRVNALWSRCRVATVPARMQEMEAVVVPMAGAVVEEEEEVIGEDFKILGGWSSGGVRWVLLGLLWRLLGAATPEVSYSILCTIFSLDTGNKSFLQAAADKINKASSGDILMTTFGYP
ncbi:conserved hypothetical protein [Histoplasma capsulatum H143]|uniref:Uncharacterized protein n=1 Tax=Ajellomyces capsulatus (strain H143) TaxID=544712 RepID=C6HFC6_AJECH|nr:conserved hypothetical protein [Histoplasma capsulatum H143]